MRYAARADHNQQAIVDALRQLGATVISLHRVGGGVPDLLVGFRGMNLLVEVKADGGELNSAQVGWHKWWRGQVAVVRSVDEAIRLLQNMER